MLAFPTPQQARVRRRLRCCWSGRRRRFGRDPSSPTRSSPWSSDGEKRPETVQEIGLYLQPQEVRLTLFPTSRTEDCGSVARYARQTFREERIVGKEVELLGHHLATGPAINPAQLELQPDPGVATRLVADAPELAVVPTRLGPATTPADCFFPAERA